MISFLFIIESFFNNSYFVAIMRLPELLAPAGNWAMLRAAVDAGCDAVYFGLKILNMRATANNFEISELSKVVKFCHDNKIRAHLTLNIIIYEDELEKAELVVKEAKKANIDAIICWDLSVIRLCKKHDVPFHISTQASISNSESAKFYADLGAERIILARECTLEQIKDLKSKVGNLPIETFIHGAMCVAVSGRCFMSQFSYCKSANKGDCIQPCRRSYKIIDEETGKEFSVENNYIMSAKDLCTMPILDKIVDAGISSLKIEGRAKAPEYVKTVVSCYRKAIDAIGNDTFTEDLKLKLYNELKISFNRDFSFGFYLGNPGFSKYFTAREVYKRNKNNRRKFNEMG